MDAHLAFRTEGWKGKRLHLGVCGSVAAYRALDLVRQWQDAGLSVSATLTPAAQKFVTPLTFAALGASPVYTAPFDDAQAPTPFAHLEPGQVAQALVIAPASAATIWTKASDIMKDVYTQILGISTIAAVVTAAVALLMINFGHTDRSTQEARSWLKRIIITWIILNSLGFIMAYITPFFSGGQWTPS